MMAKQASARKIKNRPRGRTGRNADTSAEVVRTPAVRREPRELTAKLGRRVAAHSPRAATTTRSPASSTADSGVECWAAAKIPFLQQEIPVLKAE
jgi:hypothetical protein